MKKSVSLALMILMLPFYLYASDYYVDAVNGSNDNSGTSKDDAWKTITYAISHVEGSEENPVTIKVAEGIYNLDNGEIFPLEMKNHLHLIGTGTQKSIIDAKGANSSVINCNNIPKSYLEGLTITNGRSSEGGGINCNASEMIIKNCEILGNFADTLGGGIYINESFVQIYDSKICYNEAEVGGGLCCVTSYLETKRCQILRNMADAGITTESSGGGFLCFDSTVIMDDCLVYDNEAYVGIGGGLVFNECQSVDLRSCVIQENGAGASFGKYYTFGGYAGGIYLYSVKATLMNCVITDNGTSLEGGGICCYSNSIITNTTIANNHDWTDSGIVFDYHNASVISNSIICGSFIDDDFNNSDLVVSYSLIRELSSNPKMIPLFTKNPWGDYYLSQESAGQNVTSPCVDAGNPIPPLGFDYQWRTTRTDGIFDTDRIDMGYHYPSHVQFDLNIEPDKDSFKEGDNISLTTDITTAPYEKDILVDIYFVMLNPEGDVYSYPRWDMGIQPAVENLPLPANLALNDVSLLEITLPSEKPPIKDPGTYTFAIAATKPDTVNFISNIATISFCVE